jgi:hypothetical protein
MNRLFLVTGNWHLGTIFITPIAPTSRLPALAVWNFRIVALRWLAPVFSRFLCHFSGTPRASRPPFPPTQRLTPLLSHSTSAAIFAILPFVP